MGAKHLFTQPERNEPLSRFRLNPDRELVFPDIWRKEMYLMEANAGKGGTRK